MQKTQLLEILRINATKAGLAACISLGRCCAQSRSEDELHTFHNSASCITTAHPPTTFRSKWEREKFRIYSPFYFLQLCRVGIVEGHIIAEDIACCFDKTGALNCVSMCQQHLMNSVVSHTAVLHMDHKQSAQYFYS